MENKSLNNLSKRAKKMLYHSLAYLAHFYDNLPSQEEFEKSKEYFVKMDKIEGKRAKEERLDKLHEIYKIGPKENDLEIGARFSFPLNIVPKKGLGDEDYVNGSVPPKDFPFMKNCNEKFDYKLTNEEGKVIKRFLGEYASYLLNEKSHLITAQEQEMLKDVLFGVNYGASAGLKINLLEKEFRKNKEIYRINKSNEPLITLDVKGISKIQKDETKYKFENSYNLKRFEEIPELSDKGKTIFYKTNCPGIGEVEASINIRYILNEKGDKN